MIIQCPACATRYVVPDTAIGVDGRTVRCAKCRHSWFQDGPVIEVPADRGAAVPARPPVPASPPAPAPAEQADADPAAYDGGYSQAAPPAAGQVRYTTEAVSQFDADPPFRRRRNPLKMWSWAAGIFAVVAAGLILAVSFLGLPDWVPVDRPTFAAVQPDLRLDFPPEQQERRQLPNGTEFFGASGTITNIGTQSRSLPTVLIVLRDGRDRIVYSWEVPPPKRTLAPGESVTINEAVTDIPRSARFAEIGWKPE